MAASLTPPLATARIHHCSRLRAANADMIFINPNLLIDRLGCCTL
jgi:hypothetical protein